MKTLEWLLTWFRSHGVDTENLHLEDNYFEKGYVDSLGMIELIGEIEQRFGVTFTDEQFHDPAFMTAAGLVNAVEQLQEGGSTSARPT